MTIWGGFLRDADGAVVAVSYAAAVLPLQEWGGYLRDAEGALVLRLA